MNYKLTLREVLAWLTLLIAFLLLGASVGFAQQKVVVINKKDGKAHIQVTETGNGKNVKIDTTVSADDKEELERLISELTGEKDSPSKTKDKKIKIYVDNDDDHDGKLSKRKHCEVNVNIDEKEIQAEIKEAMREMKRNLNDMDKSLSKMHIEINGSDDDRNFNFDFNFPDSMMEKINKAYSYSYSFSDDDEKEIEELNDEDHFTITGDENEEAPVLEKVVKSKNGKQVFVYKRSENSKSKKSQPSKEEISSETNDIRVFPNPSKGTFTLSFKNENKSDVDVEVLDESGKSVYTEKVKQVSGEYSKQIDLSSFGKGTYHVKVSKDGRSILKTIVIN